MAPNTNTYKINPSLPHERDDNRLFLSSLKSVHCSNLQFPGLTCSLFATFTHDDDDNDDKDDDDNDDYDDDDDDDDEEEHNNTCTV